MRRLLAALELRLPPPLVAVLCIGLMLKLAWALRGWQYPFAGRFIVAGLVATAGLALALAGARALRRAHTTISPFSPHKTAVLVVNGIYGRTRNPMYLGLALVLVGIAIALANPAALAGPALFVLDRPLPDPAGGARADRPHRLRVHRLPRGHPALALTGR